MKYIKLYNEVIKIDFAGKNDWLLSAMKEVESYFQYVDDDGYSVHIDKSGSSSTPMGLISKCSDLGRDVNDPPYIEVTIAKELYAERAFKHEPDANMFELTDELIKGIGFAVKGLEKEGIKLYMTMIQHRTYREHQEMLHLSDSTISVSNMVSFLNKGYDNNVMGYQGRVGYIRLYFYVEPHVAAGSYKSWAKQPGIYESAFTTGTELTNIINLNLEDNKEFEIEDISYRMNQNFNTSGVYPIIGTGSGYKTIVINIIESFINNEYISNALSHATKLDDIKIIEEWVAKINRNVFSRLARKYDFKIDTLKAVIANSSRQPHFLVTFNIYY